MDMIARLRNLAAAGVDGLYRRLHGKRYLPPWSLRFTVGSPADFEVTGAEFVAYLKLLCGLESHHALLDIGCGCGMIPLQLRDYIGDGGRYVGMDIDRRAIAWCQAHLTFRYARFAFQHADLHNPRYNPTGALSATDFRFPEPDAGFDVILLKSVFTHMQPAGVQNYLGEIARLLKPEGRCLATFFLLNDDHAAHVRQGRGALSFDYGDEACRYADPALPERAVAYREEEVLGMLEHCGLALAAPPYYGSWSGRPNGLSFQDVLLISREK